MSGSKRRAPKAEKPIFPARSTIHIEVGQAGEDRAAFTALFGQPSSPRDQVAANLGTIKAAASACLQDGTLVHSHQHASRALSAAEFVEERLGDLPEYAQLVVHSAMIAARLHAELQVNVVLGPAVDQVRRTRSSMPRAAASANDKRKRAADHAAKKAFQEWLTEEVRNRFTANGVLDVDRALKQFCSPTKRHPVSTNDAKRLRRLRREGALTP